MSLIIDMQRPRLQYLVDTLSEESRVSISALLKCGPDACEVVDAMVRSTGVHDVISDIPLTNHDVFWEFLIEAAYPAFYTCTKNLDLPELEKSDFRQTSIWKDLYTELSALQMDENASSALETILSWDETIAWEEENNLDPEPLRNCETILLVLGLQEREFNDRHLVCAPIISKYIDLALPVSLRFYLTAKDKLRLLLSSFEQGELGVAKILVEVLQVSKKKAKALFLSASKSPHEKAMSIALRCITSSNKDLTKMLKRLFRLTWSSTGQGVFELVYELPHLVEMIRAIIEDGRADLTFMGNGLLVYASGKGEEELVSLLLSAPNVDPCARKGSALIYAASFGHTEVVRLLLAHAGLKGPEDGASVLTEDMKKKAAEAAVENDHHGPLLLLLSHLTHPYSIVWYCVLYSRIMILESILPILVEIRTTLVLPEPYIYPLFVFTSVSQRKCTKLIMSHLSLDLAKEEMILINFIDYSDEVEMDFYREESMKYLLDSIGLVSGEKYAAAVQRVCEQGSPKVLDVLLQYGASMGLRISELELDEAMATAVSIENSKMVSSLLLGATPEAHARWISNAHRSDPEFRIPLLKTLLAINKGGNLRQARISSMAALARNDIDALRVFMECPDFNPSAENSFLLEIALSLNEPEVALGLILSHPRASEKLDKEGIKKLFTEIFRLDKKDPGRTVNRGTLFTGCHKKDLLRMAIIQRGMKESKLETETLREIAKREGWKDASEDSLRVDFEEEREKLKEKRNNRRSLV